MALVAKYADLNPTRRSLLNRLKDWRDQESWQQFFNGYWRLVYSIALKAGLTDTEAEEVVQETFIAVAKKMPEFNYDPETGSFRSWLIHTTQWKVADQFRKRNKVPAHHPAPGDERRTATIERLPDEKPLELERVCEDEWVNNLFQVAVEKVKRRVSPKQYQIFEACVLKEWPVKKVARIFSTTEGAIYVAKHRVAELVQKELKVLKEKTL